MSSVISLLRAYVAMERIVQMMTDCVDWGKP